MKQQITENEENIFLGENGPGGVGSDLKWRNFMIGIFFVHYNETNVSPYR